MTTESKRFFRQGKIYALDLERLDEAREFLDLKLAAADHAREEILMSLNRGVTTLQQVVLGAGERAMNVTRETRDRAELARLRRSLDLFLFELGGVADALLQAVNVAFNFNYPQHPGLEAKVQKALWETTKTILKLPAPACEDIGLQRWARVGKGGDPKFQEVWRLRNAATHRHLVRMRERRAWHEAKASAPPPPGKLRSEFYVDLEGGREQALDEFVTLSFDTVVRLLNVTCKRLVVILSLAIAHHGGRDAAERRRTWHGSGRTGCSHPVVEPRRDEDGAPLDPYFCSDCGVRIEDPAGHLDPKGFRHR